MEVNLYHYEQSKTKSVDVEVEMDDKDKKVFKVIFFIIFFEVLAVFMLVMFKILPFWAIFVGFIPALIFIAYFLIKYFALKKGQKPITTVKATTEIDGKNIKEDVEITTETPDGQVIEKEQYSYDSTEESKAE